MINMKTQNWSDLMCYMILKCLLINEKNDFHWVVDGLIINGLIIQIWNLVDHVLIN